MEYGKENTLSWKILKLGNMSNFPGRKILQMFSSFKISNIQVSKLSNFQASRFSIFKVSNWGSFAHFLKEINTNPPNPSAAKIHQMFSSFKIFKLQISKLQNFQTSKFPSFKYSSFKYSSFKIFQDKVLPLYFLCISFAFPIYSLYVSFVFAL